MARRRQKRVAEDVLVVDVADKGKAVAKDSEGRVYFVDGAVPGDVVDILVLRKRKSHFQGVVQQYKSYSTDRISAPCQHFGVCGGCKWQHLDYQAQLKYKHNTVLSAATRIGKVDESVIRPIKGSEKIFHYRNKVEYSFSNKRWLTEEEVRSDDDIQQSPALGYHRPGAWDKIVPIHECLLQDPLTDKIRNGLRDYTMEHGISYYDPRAHVGMMRNVIVRCTTRGDWMVIVSFGEDDMGIITGVMEHLKVSVPEITSLHYVINQKQNDTILDQDIICYDGKPFIIEQLGDVKYKVSPKSFFQTNSTQAKVLFDTVAEYAGLRGDENVYDLYTGLGSIALYVSSSVAHIVGIEEVPAAIEDAKINAALNDITNATFYAGDVKDILTDSFADKHGKPDVIITDPPRAGMHGDVVQMLLKLEAPRIVYVSCNPATQARDLDLLSEKYNTISMQPVDMFPHTHHIESVALLELKA